MEHITAILVMVLWLWTINAISLHRQNGSLPRVLHLGLERDTVTDPIAYGKMQKRGVISGVLENTKVLYLLNVTIGNPQQELRAQLDTGSSDLVVHTSSSSLCNSKQCLTGAYNANASSTYEYIDSNFTILYGDQTDASGDYVTDTVRFQGIEIMSLQLGIGYNSTVPNNVLGIGYPANEAQAQRGGRTCMNLPARLAADGKIASNAYSLWLNDLHANVGSVLFGGVDAAHYQGDLISVPIQKDASDVEAFFITMTGLEINGSISIANDIALPVLLDSGTTLTKLPSDLTQSIYEHFNATFLEKEELALVSCSVLEQNTTMTFKFSDPAAITVPISQMVFNPAGIEGQKPSLPDGEPACIFGIIPAGENGVSFLGDSFLRNAYVVYDLDNNEISLAQTVFNSIESDIMEIGKGNASVPFATPASFPVAATFASGNATQTTVFKGDGVVGRVPDISLVVFATVLSFMVEMGGVTG